jgi:hypothetical protein
MHHYKLEKLTISQYLQNISGAICLTTDIWTSKPMDSYCGITAHFIDESWKPCHIVLDVVPMSQPHTGEAIKDILMEAIVTFGIEKKILTLTTDNGSSVVKAFELLKADMHTKFDRRIYHIRCAAHVINLAVQEGLKYISKSDEFIR